MDIYVKERMNLFIAFIISQLDLFANFKYFIRISNFFVTIQAYTETGNQKG